MCWTQGHCVAGMIIPTKNSNGTIGSPTVSQPNAPPCVPILSKEAMKLSLNVMQNICIHLTICCIINYSTKSICPKIIQMIQQWKLHQTAFNWYMNELSGLISTRNAIILVNHNKRKWKEHLQFQKWYISAINTHRKVKYSTFHFLRTYKFTNFY